ncbi:MAG: roadblock/LC7 domain-containing protein [Methanobacteriota archaeon]|nr:MAG: roadblock/LC7 domain-containing protein [Euryarchaeota archaeon]
MDEAHVRLVPQHRHEDRLLAGSGRHHHPDMRVHDRLVERSEAHLHSGHLRRPDDRGGHRRDPPPRGGAGMTDVWTRIEETIDELSHVTDIKSCAVVRRDGLVVTHTLPDGVDPKIVAAMTAAIVGTSEMATIQLAQGRLRRAIVTPRMPGRRRSSASTDWRRAPASAVI